MKCPYCHQEDTQVTDSRLTADGDAVKRRRRCKQCGRRFTTYERIERIGLMVVKKDNTREEYSRDKLARSIEVACTKRPVPADQLEEAVNDIEAHLFKLGASEVSTEAIGEKVMHKLRELDEVAYIRFASVYRNFADLEEMREAMEGVGTLLPGERDLDTMPHSEEPESRGRTRG
ncbi:MAG: transcriptional repressor NrdR [Chloroflexi bacterium]|nr:transcriptional repressor NrdR [Chloroflexota bacterium]